MNSHTGSNVFIVFEFGSPHSVFSASLPWLSVLFTGAQTWQTRARLWEKKVVGKFSLKKKKSQRVSRSKARPRRSWSLSKHEYHLLIRLLYLLKYEPTLHLDVLPLNASADSLWLSITPHQSPSLLCLRLSLSQYGPMLTECKSYFSLFHQALCSLNVRWAMPTSPGTTIYTWWLWSGSGSGSVFSLSKYTLNHGPDMGWHTAYLVCIPGI